MHPTSSQTQSLLHILGRFGWMVFSGKERSYRGLFFVCTLLSIYPFWMGPILPFQDYAGNMTYAALLGQGGVPGTTFDELFELGHVFLPNGLLFYLWTWLGNVLGYVTAGKVLLSCYAFLLPLSVERCLVASGRERYFALLAFPLVFNSNIVMGFVSYATAIPLIFFTLASAYRLVSGPSMVRASVVAGLSMLTFVGHAQAYLTLGAMAIAFALFVPRTRREFFWTCAAFGASLVIFMPWFFNEFIRPPDKTALGGRELFPVFQGPGQLVGRWVEYSVGRWKGNFDDWTFLAISAVCVVGVGSRRFERLPSAGRARFGIEAISIALVITYLTVPEHTVNQAAIGSRLVAVAMLAGLGWLHVPELKWLRATITAFMVGITVFYSSHVAGAIEHYNQVEVGPGFLDLLDQLPEGSRLAVFIEDPESDVVRVRPHEHIYGYHFVRNHGVAYSMFHSYHGRHARWKAGMEIPYPGRMARPFLKWRTVCWYDQILVRSAEIPRWKHLSERLTFMGKSAQYSLWHIEKDRIPMCRFPASETGKQIALAKAKVKDSKSNMRRPLSSTLAPRVGHARGRDMGGAPRLRRTGGASARNTKRSRSLGLGRSDAIASQPWWTSFLLTNDGKNTGRQMKHVPVMGQHTLKKADSRSGHSQ